MAQDSWCEKTFAQTPRSRPPRTGQDGAMPTSDLDITRTVHRWIQHQRCRRHGESARVVEEMRRKSDAAGADTWLRIIVAIGTLDTPPH